MTTPRFAPSMFMWTSSSLLSHEKRPLLISDSIASSPAWMALRSLTVIRPTWASIAACALLPATSKGASRRSHETDSLNLSMSSAGPDLKRPPQVACLGLAMDDGKRDDARRSTGATRKIPARFPVCPRACAAQIRRGLRNAALVALALSAAAPVRSADDDLARFNLIDIKPTTSSLFIATVTMTMPPFARRDTVFSSTYSARVFPYFFWSESGRIWIVVPAEKIRRAALGEPVDFTGHGISRSEERRV